MKFLTLKTAVFSALLWGGTVHAQGQKPFDIPKENPVAQQKNQVAGYYRMMLGDYEVTALYDGYLSIGASAYQPFTKLTKRQLDDLISGHFRPMLGDGGVQTAVSGYLTGKITSESQFEENNLLRTAKFPRFSNEAMQKKSPYCGTFTKNRSTA